MDFKHFVNIYLTRLVFRNQQLQFWILDYCG